MLHCMQVAEQALRQWVLQCQMGFGIGINLPALDAFADSYKENPLGIGCSIAKKALALDHSLLALDLLSFWCWI